MSSGSAASAAVTSAGSSSSRTPRLPRPDAGLDHPRAGHAGRPRRRWPAVAGCGTPRACMRSAKAALSQHRSHRVEVGQPGGDAGRGEPVGAGGQLAGSSSATVPISASTRWAAATASSAWHEAGVVGTRHGHADGGQRQTGRGRVGVRGHHPVAERDQPADDRDAGGAAGAGDQDGRGSAVRVRGARVAAPAGRLGQVGAGGPVGRGTSSGPRGDREPGSGAGGRRTAVGSPRHDRGRGDRAAPRGSTERRGPSPRPVTGCSAATPAPTAAARRPAGW